MRFGAKILFDDVSLQFHHNQRYGLVGANGSGKSTLIKILSGELTSEKGQLHAPQRQTIGTLQQDHYAYENRIICDIVVEGNKQLYAALHKKNLLLNESSFAAHHCEDLAEAEKIIHAQGGYVAYSEAAKLLEGLGIAQKQHEQPLHTLSGGYKLRVLLARVLFAKPDLLILDEPTNHLDLYSIRWLENYLRNYSGTIILTSHDRDFLNGVCTQIADIDYGTIKIYSGNYNAFLERKKLDRIEKEHLLQKHEERRSDLQEFIDRFGAKASKARQAKSKGHLVERLEEQMAVLNCKPTTHVAPKLEFIPLRPSGAHVLEVKTLAKSYQERQVLNDISFAIERGERIAIIGANGMGKSTLLKILMQRITPDQGSFTWGFAAHLAYFPQDLSTEIAGDFSLLEWLGQWDSNVAQEKLRDLLGRVLFSGDVVHQKVNTLSGGEMARLVLAKIILQKPNVLLLDEPTNHLDMEAIEELARALEAFEGTLLLVSHNRYFVSRLAQRILEIGSDGINDFRGTYDEFLIREGHNDHLDRKANLQTRRTQDQNSVVAYASYATQKKAKNEKEQLKKRIAQIEKTCAHLEEQIAKIHTLMERDDFYSQHDAAQQQHFIAKCAELQKELESLLIQWENSSLTLQALEHE